MPDTRATRRTRGRRFGDGLLLTAVAALAYFTIAGGFECDYRQTFHPHHVLMADALLHGQWEIRPAAYEQYRAAVAERIAADVDAYAAQTGEDYTPTQRQAIINGLTDHKTSADWAFVDGRIYGYWAPLTPVLTAPFVALFGLDVSDRAISALFGTLNVALFYWLLCRVDRARLLNLTRDCRATLTIVFAFGTAHFWMAGNGEIWHAVQLMTLTPFLGALIAVSAAQTDWRHWLLGGLLLGAAVLGRNIIAFAGLFFVVHLWRQTTGGGASWGRFVGWLIVFCTPLAGAVALQGAYNAARFGSALESGLAVQVLSGGHSRFIEPFETYGPFALQYVPHNLFYYFVNWTFPRDEFGRLWFDVEGNSLFIVTPLLLYVFLAWRSRTMFVAALFAGALPVVAMLMLYFATGVTQFGPRYLTDIMPLLLLAAAAGMRGRLTAPAYVLAVLAVALHLFGTFRMCEEEFALVTPLTSPAWFIPAVAAAIIVGVLRFRPASAAQRDARSGE